MSENDLLPLTELRNLPAAFLVGLIVLAAGSLRRQAAALLRALADLVEQEPA